MKKIQQMASVLLLSVFAFKANAKGDMEKAKPSKLAYHIVLKMPGVDDSLVFMVHYYGKGGSTIYKSDSAKFKKGVAIFNSTDSTFVGGSYMMLLSDKKTNFEFLVNRGDDFTITANTDKLPDGIKFTNSPENERFQDYQRYARKYGENEQKLVKELESAKTKADTDAIRKRGTEASKEFANYRKEMVKNNPGTLLANILKALEKPEIPEGEHFLEDGKTKDSTFAYRYYKAHYWDNFDFRDDRLIYTPLYDGMLEEYMNKLVLPFQQSITTRDKMVKALKIGGDERSNYILVQ